MLPFLQFWGLSIPMYWLCGVIGIAAGILVIFLRKKKFLVPTADVIHILLFCAIGGLIGSKLLSLITLIPSLAAHPELFTPQNLFLILMNGGGVFFGAFIGAILFTLLYTRKYKIDIRAVMDLFTPSIPLFHAFGRIGCFMGGCCYGIPVSWGISFTCSQGAPNGIPLLPIQLIESGLNFLLFLFLLLWKPKRMVPGRLFMVYLICYSVIRFTLEFFRGDAVRGFFLFLSTSQWISIFLLILGVFGTIRLSRQNSVE